MNEVMLNKKISLERCIAQIEKYYRADTGLAFEEDYLKQDAIAMNLQRACELAIDMANHAIKCKKLGLPQDSKDSFNLLQRAGLIGPGPLKMLHAMVGFRNVLVHQYQKLDLRIMVDVIEHHLPELLDFANVLLKAAQ